MANADKYLGKIGVYSNEKKLIKAVIDFSKGDELSTFYEAMIANENLLVHKITGKVLTTFTSGGSATVSFGTSGDVDKFLEERSMAQLVANDVLSGEHGAGLYVASGSSIGFTIAVANLTAGKMEVEMEVTQF